MNGMSDGTEPNGHGGSSDTDDQILRALQAVHDPRSTNELRQEASQFLEKVRLDQKAPQHGFSLASSVSQPPFVRHYGLSLLEYAVCHSWQDYSLEQGVALRDWVISLVQAMNETDPQYLRNKAAKVWVDVVKQSWTETWMDMDEHLVRLWEGTTVKRLMVLAILDTLSEEVFGDDDPTAGTRASDLNRACVEIFTPAAVLRDRFPTRDTNINVRYGEEGWLTRLASLLEWSSSNDKPDGERQACTLAALTTVKSVMNWAVPQALVATSMLERICACLVSANIQIQLAATDALYQLYDRPGFSKDVWIGLVSPMYRPESVNLLSQVFEWSAVDATNIDDEKYLLSKKISEVMFTLGTLLEAKEQILLQDLDLSHFFGLLLMVLRSESLSVSIPAVHVWVKLLKDGNPAISTAATSVMGELLATCSERLLRYEALPEDSNLPSILFLNEDIDTMPERHAFLGNYSRFCNQVVEAITLKQPVDALYHILAQADQLLSHLYDHEAPFQASSFKKNSIPYLRVDGQFSVIEAALKGAGKWLSSKQSSEHEHETLVSNLQVWCDQLLGLSFEDPQIKERVIHLAVGFVSGPLKSNAIFAYKIFLHILETRCPRDTPSEAYNELAKDLQGLCVHHLTRLSMRFSDYFSTIFEEIELKIHETCQTIGADEQSRIRYMSILFVIISRAADIDSAARYGRLDQFLRPIISQWQNPGLGQRLSSYASFCELLGLSDVQKYLSARGVHRIQDWSSQPLDNEGKALQQRMTVSLEGLPIRATKTLLSVSVEKLDPSLPIFKVACDLWRPHMPVILPNLLQLISQAHAFHEPSNWTDLPLEMRGVVSRILTDRFWQVGISTGSRDDFYAKVGHTKSTLEGLASSIRAQLRAVRETGYRLLYYMSLLGDAFYSFRDLPEPLSHAIFDNACALSTHQMAMLVEMIRPIIEHCPVDCRAHFLPPLLISLFEQLDHKTNAEWDRIEAAKIRAISEDADLSDEMRDESILRQLTYTSVMLVVGLLDPQKTHPPGYIPPPKQNGSDVDRSLNKVQTVRAFILQTPEVLKPVILFCTHALHMHDTRSCSYITRVLRTLVSDFEGDGAFDNNVREFISAEVLKACITSLNDPHFVELQKDFAQLIAGILTSYCPRTGTPREVLLSLPSLSVDKVDRALYELFRANSNTRQQRAVVLNLLEGIRGISISQQGKIKKEPVKKKTAMQEKYMTTEIEPKIKGGGSPDLEGVAEMFGA